MVDAGIVGGLRREEEDSCHSHSRWEEAEESPFSLPLLAEKQGRPPACFAGRMSLVVSLPLARVLDYRPKERFRAPVSPCQSDVRLVDLFQRRHLPFPKWQGSFCFQENSESWPATYFGVQRRHKDGGHSEQAVVERNLFDRKSSHGPQNENITMATVREALGKERKR